MYLARPPASGYGGGKGFGGVSGPACLNLGVEGPPNFKKGLGCRV